MTAAALLALLRWHRVAVEAPVYPDGPNPLNWPDLIYVRVRPQWIRDNDYTQPTPRIVEFSGDQLGV